MKEIVLDGIGEIVILKNRRSRHVRITVRPDSRVHVSVPYGTSYAAAKAFILKKRAWLEKTVEKMQEKYPPVLWNFPGENRLTDHHTLILHHSSTPDLLGKITKNTLDIFIPAGSTPEDEKVLTYINALITKVLYQEARQHLSERIAYLARKYHFTYGRLSFRNMKSRWGSCSPGNNISLNIHLMQLPHELRDYVLLHELVHTRIKNHGPGFWKRLNEVTGDQAKAMQREIRKYSSLNHYKQ